jgi:hypothetical protein
MEESFKDFNWDLNRFVEYRSPFTKKRNITNYINSVYWLLFIHYQLKNQFRFSVRTEIVVH